MTPHLLIQPGFPMNTHRTGAARGRQVLLRLLLCGLFLISGQNLANAADHPDQLMTQGSEAFHRGDFEQALAAWKDAARLLGNQGAARPQIQALLGAAQAAQILGHTKQALQSLELALTLAQQHADTLWQATVLAQLGRTYLATRHLDMAADLLAQAHRMAGHHPSPSLMASILNDQGILAVLQKNEADALAAFAEAIRLAQAGQAPMVALHAQINAARAALRLGRPDDSRQWADQALEHLTQLPPSHDKAHALVRVGHLYARLRAQQPDIQSPLLLRAAGALQESATVAESLGDARTLSYALGYLGHLYETDHRLDDAIHLTRQARFAAQSIDAPESLYRWEWQLGRELGLAGQLDEAIDAYRHAVATLQPIRPQLIQTHAGDPPDEQDTIRPLFFELADLLLQRVSRSPGTPGIEQDILAARDAIEAYKAAELRDYFRDDCVDALQARTMPFDRLAPSTAVVYPILFPTRLELLVSLPTGFTRYLVPIDATQVTQEVRAFRRLLEKRTTHEYLPHAQRLYDWLVRPIQADLDRLHITTLVFVPDRALRTVPMAALHDGTAFLIDRYAIASTPGLTLTDPHPLDRTRTRILAAGLTVSVQGFPALPYIAEELASIQSLYKGQRLENHDFLATRLETELREGRYGVLHIATHGHFSPEPADSFLLTYDGKLTMTQLDRLVGLLRFRQDPLELLTLSACQTGIGDDRAALGLAGVAIKAGARSALASLWFINDEASTALIGEFYRQLNNPSASKAEALQRAQRHLLKDRVYAHPAYWAAFLLLNNWL